ncbi:MAG: hypothetical protein R3C58_16230 [Parvularculaceae bacterium]
MSGVKRSSAAASKKAAFLAKGLPILLGLAAAGCAEGDLLRFAPPGVVKYEDLAGDKPMNPDVAERIKERRKDPSVRGYPSLSDAPKEDDAPAKPPAAEIAASKAELSGARDELAGEVATDRAEAALETERDMAAEREALRERIEKDEAAAARERREKLVAPPVETPDPEEN